MIQWKKFLPGERDFTGIILCLICLVLIFPLHGIVYGQNTPEITTLEKEKAVEREIASGQKDIYQIVLAANQYAKIIVEQRGIDVVVRRLEADGKTFVEYDFDPRPNGEETVEMTVQTAGNYQLTVEPRQKKAAAGRYQIRLVEIRAATEKEPKIDEIRHLLTEAVRLWWLENYAEAQPLAEQALAICEKELGRESFNYSQAASVLANILSDKGELAKAALFYQQALELREKIMGKDHISLTGILNNYGTLCKDQGQYEKAETLLLRSLKIREKELGPNHPLVASVLINLGNLSNEKGDDVKAKEFFQRALEIREKTFGPESAEVAQTLNNLAGTYGSFEEAEPLYLRALAIREKIFGPDHQEVGQTLYNLALLYVAAGKYAKARTLCERAMTNMEKNIGDGHPYTSYPANLLGVIYKNTGEYEKSEAFFLRAMAIREKTQGPYHPLLGGVIANLASMYVAKGDIEKAVATQTRANTILEFNAELNLATGSEREKFSYLQTFSNVGNRTLSLNAKTAPDSQAATDLAVTNVLQRKGRVLDAMSDNLAALRRRFNGQDQILLDKLNETTTRLVKLVLEGSEDSAEGYQKKIEGLEREREDLEAEISRRSAGFYEKTKPITLKAVQEAIPENAALIEVAVFRPVSSKVAEAGIGLPPDAVEDPRYIVYVIRRRGEVKFRDLGEAKTIDAGLDLFRQALRDPKRKDVGQLARTVDEKIMAPIRELLGDATQLLISPDGNLNLIPFEALMDEKNHYLIENYAVSYLTSGRDLLRLGTVRESKSKPLIVANPAFGEPNPETTAGTTRRNSRNLKRSSITVTGSLSDTYFAPLGGTAQEGRLIQTIFPEASFLSGAQATETALKQAVAPEILHIATHGFFLEDEDGSGSGNKIENPLLRSGLALAGANQRSKDQDDGLLTALEASGLNLWGTKLVVLSACDTGLGEVRNGEGVYGLRRAFVLAGTESLVMSLWPVSDLTTRELMTSYYKNLKQGMGRGAALRQVQLEMLKKPTRQHPFYWASFIQSGEWANLDGKR